MFRIEGVKNSTCFRVYIDTELNASQPRRYLEWEANCELSAQALAIHLAKLMGNKLRAVRKKAYGEGWRDKASHQTPKATHFRGDWETEGRSTL